MPLTHPLLVALAMTFGALDLGHFGCGPEANQFANTAPALMQRPSLVGQVSGTIVDQAGALVPGAKVTLKNQQTGLERSTQTKANGTFSISGLPIGTYDVTVSAPGYFDTRLPDTKISVASAPNLRIQLRASVGAANGNRTVGRQGNSNATDRLRRHQFEPQVTQTPKDQITDKRTESGTTDNPEKFIGDEIDKLASGKIVFNPPAEMQVARNVTIEVRVSGSLLPGLTEGLKGTGPVQTDTLKVGPYMGVSLKGSEGFFEIGSLSGDERQLIGDKEFAQWLFDVVPIKEGTASLTLTASVILDTPSGEKPYDRPVFVREIKVSTAPKPPFIRTVGPSVLGFLANNWDKLIGVLVSTGLLGGLVAWLKKRRKSKRARPGGRSPRKKV